MKKVMIVLGIVLVSLGTISGCKGKSEEEKIGALLEKLDKAERAGNEKEAERINKEIQELTDKQIKKEKEGIKKETITKERAILSKSNLRAFIVGKYTIEEIDEGGKTERLPGIMTFKEDGVMVISHPGYGTKVLPARWRVNGDAIQIEEEGEQVEGKFWGNTIIFKVRGGELRYVKQN